VENMEYDSPRLKIRATGMPYIPPPLLLTVMPLLFFVRLPSLTSDRNFSPVALGTHS
jgi:hypothetical protein